MSDTWRQNAIVQAIQIIADKKIAQAGYDKTRKGVISQVIDKTSGKYRVKYQDSQFQAYATSSNVYYEVGQLVSFLVPGNDWSREITIINGVKNYATNYAEVPEASQLYNKTGPSAIKSEGVFGLCSYKTEEKSLIEEGFLKIDQQIGKTYIPQGNGLVIGMDVQTSLDSGQVNGNYGLRFDLVFRNIQTGSQNDELDFSQGGAAVRSYFVTDRDVIGNPYGLTKTTTVEHLLNIDDINPADFVGIKDIVAYCNGFPLKSEDKDNDIFFSNIHINGVEVLSEQDLNGYVVHIDYSETGQIIEKVPQVQEGEQPKIITVKLQASLKVNGKKVTSEDQLSYYWFRQNGLIFRNSPRYSSYGGDGWECLNNFSNGEPSQQNNMGKPIPATNTIYFTSGTERKNVPLTIPASAYNTRIKCVIVYKYKETSGFQNVINKNVENFYIDSNQKQSGNDSNKVDYYLDYGMPTLTCLPQNYDPEKDTLRNYIFRWSVIPARGQGTQIQETDDTDYNRIKNQYQTAQKQIEKVPQADLDNYKTATGYQVKVNKYDRIKNISYVNKNIYYNFPISSIINYSRIICNVYYKEEEEEIYKGSASITLYNHTQVPDTYSLNIENSTQVFQYDGKGNSPTSPQLEKPLQIKPLTFTLIDDEGNQISYQQIINNGYVEWIIPIQNTLLISDDKKNGSPQLDSLLIGTDRALAASLGYEVNIYKRPHKGTEEENGDYTKNLASFVYKIEDTYDSKKVNNNIRLDVKYKDMLFTAYTDFTFPKDGDPGTNGTDYVAKLIPINDKEEVINTDRLYVDSKGDRYTDNGNQFDKLKFQLYNNSNVVDNTVNFWTCPPKTSFKGTTADKIDKNNENHYINVNQYGKIERNEEFVNKYDEVLTDKVVDIVRAQNGTENNIKYFAQYPICFSYLEKVKDENNNKKTVPYRFKVRPKTGFKYVVYAQDGTSPDYDKTLPFEIVVEEYSQYKKEQDAQGKPVYGYYYIETTDKLSYQWEVIGPYLQLDNKLNENNGINIILGTQTGNNKCYFKPKDKFVSTDLFSAIIVFIKKGNTSLGWLHIPIYMVINRYGHSALNGWDGTSIQMKQGGDTILAPQVGAGTKNSNNQFTGVLIGDVKTGDDDKNKQGLFGYHQGQRSIFLDATTGNATFGKQGAAQIKIDASSGQGTISSGDYTPSTIENGKTKHDGRGMKIKFSSTTGEDGQLGPYIRFGSDNFSVTADGSIHASGSGDIAGWFIDDNRIYKGNTGMSSQVIKVSDIDPSKARPNQGSTVAFYAGQVTEQNETKASPNFYVTHSGYLFSKSGKIATWDINKDNLSNGTVGMGQNKIIPENTFRNQTTAITDARIWSGNKDTTTFAVTANGKFYSKEGQIANWVINKARLSDSNVGMGQVVFQKADSDSKNPFGEAITARFWGASGALTISDNDNGVGTVADNSNSGINNLNFAVSNTGKLYSRSGKIGGWTITDTKLSASGIDINSTGDIQSNYSTNSKTGYSIKGNGNAVFYNIDANRGTIGSCTINDNSISASKKSGDKTNTWYINSDGTASFNNITASGGTIGGMTITSDTVSGTGGWYITNNNAYFPGLRVDSSGGVSSGGSGITGGTSGAGWSMPGSGKPTMSYDGGTMTPRKIRVYEKLVLNKRVITGGDGHWSLPTETEIVNGFITGGSISGSLSGSISGTTSDGKTVSGTCSIRVNTTDLTFTPSIDTGKTYYIPINVDNRIDSIVTGWHSDTTVKDWYVMASSASISNPSSQIT